LPVGARRNLSADGWTVFGQLRSICEADDS
jgi:hypothetical protein